MEVKVKINKSFERWGVLHKRIKVAFGGRGGTKSFSLMWLLLLKSFDDENRNMVFLVARETLNSIEDSSYALLKSLIEENNLQEYFDITKSYILNRGTNVKFRFIGVREYGIKRVKSIHNIKYCYIDEAEDLSINSWTILEPSVRGNGAEMWVSFNPNRESDFSYSLVKPYLDKLEEKSFWSPRIRKKKFYYHEYEGEDIYIIKVNFYSSSFYNATLEKSREMCLKQTPALYNHIWLGECKKEVGRVFSQSVLRFYDYNYFKEELEPHYVKRAIVDPAFGRENCFTSCVIYIQVGNDFYIIDAGLMRTDGVVTTDEALSKFLKSYEIKEVLCEANFHQNELVKKLKREFYVRPFYQRVDKIERIVDSAIEIREHVLFDKDSVSSPEGTDTEQWLITREGRNFIGMMQLLNFSDIKTENNKKGDDFSYIDFVDVVSSLVKYGKRRDKTRVDTKIVAMEQIKEYNKSSSKIIKKGKRRISFSYE